jgi:membrane protein implicated in regulation of membrane protease activity
MGKGFVVMQGIETVCGLEIERILLFIFVIIIAVYIVVVCLRRWFKKITNYIDEEIGRQVYVIGGDKVRLTKEDQIKNLLNSQLYSTYADAPIDGKQWEFKFSLVGFFHRIGSVFGVFRGDFAHDDITIKVFRRLFLRHGLLNAVEKMASCHFVNGDCQQLENGVLSKEALQSFSANKYADVFASSASRIGGDACEYSPDVFNLLLLGKNPERLNILTQNTTHEVNSAIGDSTSENDCKNQPFLLLPKKLRAYNLAVTDLFVEKALAYLNRKAKAYNRWAKSFVAIALLAVIFGSSVAFINSIDWNDDISPIVKIAKKTGFWIESLFKDENDSDKVRSAMDSIMYAEIPKVPDVTNITHLLGQQRVSTHPGHEAPDVPKRIKISATSNVAAANKVLSVIQNSASGAISEKEMAPYLLAFEKMVKANPHTDTKGIAVALFDLIGSDRNTQQWTTLITKFVKGFTFYGLLVLLAVFCYRMARALFDQAERLKDRRHALRQGRLFVHLNGGKMSVDEMEKAFNWNMTSENAFANINPDAQAPWGNVVKEMLKTIRETSKAGIKAAERK